MPESLRRAVGPLSSGSVVNGSQKSGMSKFGILAPKKPGGVTPTTVNEWPFRSNAAPTTDGSDPYFACQMRKLITATEGAPSQIVAIAEQPGRSKRKCRKF